MTDTVENFITEAEATAGAMNKIATALEAEYALELARLLDRYGDSPQNKKIKERLERLRGYMDVTKVLVEGCLQHIKHLRFQAIVHEANEKKLEDLRIYVAHLERAVDNPEAITRFYEGLKKQICHGSAGES